MEANPARMLDRPGVVSRTKRDPPGNISDLKNPLKIFVVNQVSSAVSPATRTFKGTQVAANVLEAARGDNDCDARNRKENQRDGASGCRMSTRETSRVGGFQNIIG
jgi:hypothetical protein